MLNIFVILLSLLTALYLITLFYLDRGLGRLEKQNLTARRQSVTVIVAMRNEQDNIPAHLEALQNQYSTGFEIEFICVNDRSNDKTGDLLERQAQADPRFKVIHVSERDPEIAPKKKAITLAVGRASHDIILLTDADARPSRGWAASMLSFFDKDTDMVIGYAPYSIPQEHHILYHLTALEYFSVAAVAAATAGLGFPITCVGTNMAYRKKMFEAVDGFGPYKNIISGDDDLFLTHVREQKKYGIRYATLRESFVYNAPPKTFIQYFHQRLRYASKGFKYPFKVTFALSAYVILNILLAGGVLAGFFNTLFWPPVFAAFVAKGLLEFLFLKHAAAILDERRSLFWYFPASLFHPFYIIIFGILGPFNLFKWKESPTSKGKP